MENINVQNIDYIEVPENKEYTPKESSILNSVFITRNFGLEIDYIENHYDTIEKDMNSRNSTSKRKLVSGSGTNITRKKREELSISAAKVIKKEEVEIVITFN